MKAVEVGMDIRTPITIEDRLRTLCIDPDDPDPDSDDSASLSDPDDD